MKPKRKAPVDLHFRIWDSPLAAFVLEQAHRNRRPLTVELVVLVEEGRDHRNRCAAAASKRPEV